MGHFKKICSVCSKVIEQCRCTDPNKTIQFDVCEDCSTIKCLVTGKPIGEDSWGLNCKCKNCKLVVPALRPITR